MKKILVLPGDSWTSAVGMFERHGFSVVKSLPQADAVVFLGGTDVSPEIYGQKPHPKTQHPDRRRDMHEVEVYKSAFKLPKIGICRGGQLLNVLNGGKLIQDLDGIVTGTVTMVSKDGYKTDVLVDHHQGIISSKVGQKEAWNFRHPLSPEYDVFYPESKSFCFQPHPEWGHEGTEKYFFSRLEVYFPELFKKEVEAA